MQRAELTLIKNAFMKRQCFCGEAGAKNEEGRRAIALWTHGLFRLRDLAQCLAHFTAA
jgi:hypothetical protein